MNYLYKLVTTENVEINYDTFKKKEFIECLATMRNIYFSLKQENKQLEEKLDKYENPEDMTLMMMWCTEKVKDENKQLKNNWNKLKEYVSAEWYCYDNDSVEFEVAKDILNKIQEIEQGSDSND